MHDPKTVAHEIHGPRGLLHKWRRDRADRYDHNDPRFSYLSPLITIWHNDPETDGSDDSCGYTFPRVPADIKAKAEKIAVDEWKYMFGQYAYKYQQPSAYEVVYALWDMIAWRIFKRRAFTLREMQEIASLACNPADNLRSVVFDATRSEENARRLGYLVMRCYLRVNRKWYQHPKWHIHHWSIQIHFTQKFKRWAFSRCAECGKGFRWGGSPVSTSWNNNGPQWFRGEQNVYHGECAPSSRARAA